MKRYISVIFLTLVLAFQVLGAAKRPIAAIKEVMGIVKVRHVDERSFETASPGNMLYSGDRLRTFDHSSAALLFIDGSQIKVRDNSDLILQAERLDERNLDTKLDLPIGDIWAKVTRRDSKFEVETPSATASVKGTEFAIKVDEFGNSDLFVLEGLIEFQNPFGKVEVGKRQKSSASKTMAPSKPKKISKKEIPKLRAASEPKWQLGIKTRGERQAVNKSFDVQISAKDIKSNRVDKGCNIEVSAATIGSELLLSSDGSNWTSELTVKLVAGATTVKGLVKTTGENVITVSGIQAVPYKITITAEKTGRQMKAEKEKVNTVLRRMGLSEDFNKLDYKGGIVTEGLGDLEELLDKIDRGELIIVEKEVIDTPDGGKKLILKLKPKSTGDKKGGG